MDPDLIEALEGKTRIVVPRISLNSKVPPKYPAFFNPYGKISRDISIFAYRAFVSGLKDSRRTFADSLCGVGARALRVAVEVPRVSMIYGNDINEKAIEMATKSAEINSVQDKCKFGVNEVCKFLSLHRTENGDRFGIIDLDPFGTPAPYVDCVLRSVLDNGMISITATDTAVLCGVYPEVCRRRYYGMPINNTYTNETAIRLLCSMVALTASRLELAVRPLFAHSSMHYLRLYLQIKVSSSQANKTFENLGYSLYCFRCGNRRTILNDQNDGNISQICENCESRFKTGGYLWTGRIFDRQFISKMTASTNASDSQNIQDNNIENSVDGQLAARVGDIGNGASQGLQRTLENEKGKEKIQKLLESSFNELDDIPYFFTSDEIASKIKSNPKSINNILELLKSNGFRASTTIFSPTGFKTDATLGRLIEILR